MLYASCPPQTTMPKHWRRYAARSSHDPGPCGAIGHTRSAFQNIQDVHARMSWSFQLLEPLEGACDLEGYGRSAEGDQDCMPEGGHRGSHIEEPPGVNLE